MGNIQSSSNKNVDFKERVENIYNQVLSQKNIEQTIQNSYCNKLVDVIQNQVLDKYENEALLEQGKKVLLDFNIQNTDNKILCKKLSNYYVKKINLIGTIINSIRLAHLKLDRIKNGGICFDNRNNLLKNTDKLVDIPIQPTIPFNISSNIEPIFIADDFIENRKKVLEKAGINNTGLLETLSLIEIDNPNECVKNGGKWLSTRKDLENVYLVPTVSLLKENSMWVDTLNKLETNVYENVGKLVNMLDLLVEERVEPKMIEGREQRIKTFRDRSIYDKDLDSLIIKTKKQILDLFLDLDSYFLILFSMNIIKISKK